MRRLGIIAACLTVIVLTCGCAGLPSDYDPPTVIVNSFRALPSDGVAPRFEIGLNIINPNATELSLKGISYTVSLEGHRIVAGVANALPVIAPYSEGQVNLTATTDLLSSISLFADLMSQPRETFEYDLDAKLDFSGYRRDIRVSKEGRISLSGDNP